MKCPHLYRLILTRQKVSFPLPGLLLWAAVFTVALTASASATDRLYIPNFDSNTVSIVDGTTNTVTGTTGVTLQPYGVGASPDGRYVYITSLGIDRVTVIDTSTGLMIKEINVGDAPFGVSVNPAGTYAYVVNSESDSLSVISTSSLSVVGTIAVGDGPHGIAITPDGSKLYVTNYYAATVSVVSTSTGTVTRTISVGYGPHGISVNPAGSHVYVANVFSDSVSVISTASDSVVSTITTGKNPFFPAPDPAGQYLYVSNYGGASVSVINLASNTVAGTIPVGSGPHGVAVDDSGTRVYVANELGNNVSVIDAASRTVLTNIPVGTKPVAFGKFLVPATIPMPQGQNFFSPYEHMVLPFSHSKPGTAKPVGMGTVSGAGGTLSLNLGAYRFSGPVDTYFGIYAPSLDPNNIYLVSPSGIQPLSQGFMPWQTWVTDVSGPVFPDIDGTILPTGNYYFYLVVVPAGTPLELLANNFYLWTASLSVTRAIDVANLSISQMGSDAWAATAVLFAMLDGYSLEQIVDAIFAGTLSPYGHISGLKASGSSQAAAPYSRMTKGTTVESFCTDPDRKRCPEEVAVIFQGLIDSGDASNLGAGLTFAILALYDRGYSLEQINDSLIDTLLSENPFFPPAGCHDQYFNIQFAKIRFCCDCSQEDICVGFCDVQPESNKPAIFTETKSSNEKTQPPLPPTVDSDNDGVVDGSDCAPLDATSYPGGQEICGDGIDQDCDGQDLACDQCLAETGCCREYPVVCGWACISFGEQCCKPSEGAYCPDGYTCFWYPAEKCCPYGYTLCGDGIHCIVAGYESQCPSLSGHLEAPLFTPGIFTSAILQSVSRR